ncbi:MAG TPA: hypothetical protein VJP81_02565 [Candidatus Dormibacteraeota bacterium]|nr:hypothetical protein [Candidatus Dormibacteraeota bacterium]
MGQGLPALVVLEQNLFDVLAGMIRTMSSEAQRAAEETNLPVFATQVERFRHRLDYWVRRQGDLEMLLPPPPQVLQGRRSRP